MPNRPVLCLLALCAMPLVAQTNPWSPPDGARPLAPKVRCTGLRAETTYEFSIESAVLVPSAGDVPEYCQVRGQILPEIRFEVNLPSSWNRRFYMTGNGGYAGEPLDHPARMGQKNATMRRGFAHAMTNTGHDAGEEPLATFAQNRQKLLDYAFRSLHMTAVTSKRIVENYYGVQPQRSYFQGCSTGGRQALILAQRFPGDFDGIISGAPVLNFSATMVSYANIVQALAAAPIPFAKLGLLAERVYAQCDAKDGLKDGLIEDPRRCDFQPARDLPRCAADERGDCFTPAQVQTLERIYGPVMSNGKPIFTGWPVGAEIAGPNGRSGWDNWIVHETGGKTIQSAFGESFFRYMAFPQKNPSFELSQFQFDRDPARLDWIHNTLDATDPDLTPLKERGSKLIMYYGWADQALNAQMGVDYYESVQRKMGATTTDFFRFYLIPGMFHCGGGVGNEQL